MMSRASLISATLWNTEAVRARSQEALRLARVAGDDVSLGHAQTAVGLERWKAGDLDAAARAYDEGYRHFARAAQWGWAAVPLANRGLVEASRGDVDGAMRYFDEYIALSRRMGNPHAEGRILLNVGAIKSSAGAPHEAKAALERAVEILDTHEDLLGAAQARQNLGQALISLGEFESARSELIRSYERRQRTGDRVGAASCILYLGHVAFHEGRDAIAAEVLGGLLLREDDSVPWDTKSQREAEELMERLGERMGEADRDEAARRGVARDPHALYELVANPT